MKKIIETQEAPAAVGPYSQAVEINGALYISRQVPLDPATGTLVQGGIVEQTDRVMKNIGKILEEILAKDVLDSLIIETQDSDLLFITLEEIYKIDEQMKLDIDLEEIKYRQKTHTPQDHIKHYLEKRRTH